jgi:hypothetical protein
MTSGLEVSGQETVFNEEAPSADTSGIGHEGLGFEEG